MVSILAYWASVWGRTGLLGLKAWEHSINMRVCLSGRGRRYWGVWSGAWTGVWRYSDMLKGIQSSSVLPPHLLSSEWALKPAYVIRCLHARVTAPLVIAASVSTESTTAGASKTRAKNYFNVWRFAPSCGHCNSKPESSTAPAVVGAAGIGVANYQ